MPVMLKTRLNAYVKSEPIEAESAFTPNELENIFNEVEAEESTQSYDQLMEKLYQEVQDEKE